MKKTIRIVDTTPQQIYLRRAAHSAATYLGYQCQLAFAPEVMCGSPIEGDLPPDAARHSYLRMVFTQPSGMARQAPDLHPSVIIEWAGATPTILDGAGTSLATYIEGLSREILGRMRAKGLGGRS